MILVKNVTLFVLGQNRPRKVFRDVLSLFQTIKKSRSNLKFYKGVNPWFR